MRMIAPEPLGQACDGGKWENDKKEGCPQVELRKPSSESEKFLRRSKLECEEREGGERKFVLQEIASLGNRVIYLKKKMQ